MLCCALAASVAAEAQVGSGVGAQRQDQDRQAAGELSRQPSEIVDGSGRPVRWWDWLTEEGPVALLVWASWAPRADQSLGRFPALKAACGEAGLELAVIDVQEPIQDGRAVLEATGYPWFHDRHGWLLKRHRVVRIPALLILGPGGEALDIVEPTPAAIRAWKAVP